MVGRQAAITEQHDSTVLHIPKPTPVKVRSVSVQSVLSADADSGGGADPMCDRSVEVSWEDGALERLKMPVR